MITFTAGFIVDCFFMTAAIFLFCAFAYSSPAEYPDPLDDPRNNDAEQKGRTGMGHGGGSRS
jgi:hypothetical protein